MIEIQNVSKRYGRRLALSDVSLTFHAGEVILLLGANGAGKSTLLRCLLGITAFEGRIRVAGLDPLRDGAALRSLIGYMPQSGGLHLDLTVEETLGFYAAIRRVPRERGTALLREAGLAAHARAKVGDLSGGMRQRLGFTLALLADPRNLVLDEPSASLDAASREWLAARLRDAAAEGRTILVSTHAGQELLAAGDRRVMFEDGRVVADHRRTQTNTDSTRHGGTQTNTVSMSHTPTRTSTGAGNRRHKRTNTDRRAPGAVQPIVWKEIRDAFRNRWLIGYAVVLGALGLGAAATGIQSSAGLALQAFGRTTATLMNLCLLLAPLVAITMGAASIAGEHDRGTLEHLLAQPLTRARLLAGKYLGLLASLVAATVFGFLPAGVLVGNAAGYGVLGHYLLFPAIASLVGAAMLAIGMLVSVSSRTAVQSQGTGMFLWFGFVLLYDLLLMGSLALRGMPVEMLGAALVANPVDAARVLGVLALEPDLYLLGPAGAYLAARFSRIGAALLLLAALVLWPAAALAAAALRFRLSPARDKRRSAAASGAFGALMLPDGPPPGRPSRSRSSTEEVTLS